jgi:hypothetical protein
MNSVAEDIKDLLTESSMAGIHGTFATDLFVGLEPDSPDLCTTIFDTGGFDPDAYMGDSDYDYERPTIQVLVRGAPGGYQAAYSRIKAISDELKNKTNKTINSTKYMTIWQMGDIFFIGYDEAKNRPSFTVNFRIHRTST